jgi:hypothetical protein
MMLIPYNYRFKTLVNLLIGVASGRGLGWLKLTPTAGWTLVIITTAVLYVVLNYRPVFERSNNSGGRGTGGKV